jgi:FkbM family methyltransferase
MHECEEKASPDRGYEPMTTNTHNMNALTHCSSTEEWSSRLPLLMRLASLINRYSPRGKGALPRWIGRTFGADWKTTIHTDSGCVLAVDPSNLDLFVTIHNEGSWEPWVRRACIAAIREGDVVFDIGANVGAICNEIGIGRNNITVKAFEPQADLAPLIVVSAALNDLDCIEVFPVAVGDHTGTACLHRPAHALHASISTARSNNRADTECPMVSLDEVVRSGRLPVPNFMKIDVEGGELSVLRGAKWLISEHRPVIVFEANDNCARLGYSRDDLFQQITSLAEYRFFEVAPGDTLAAPVSRAQEFESAYAEIPWNK